MKKQKRVQLNHGSAMVDEDCPQATIDALNKICDIAYKMDEKICPICKGDGFTIEVEAECCRNAINGECCGIPDPVQVQKQCYCLNT